MYYSTAQPAGPSWRGLARRLEVNARIVRRWRAGTKPGFGHLVSLFDLAAGMGLLNILLPSVGEPQAVEKSEAAVGHCRWATATQAGPGAGGVPSNEQPHGTVCAPSPSTYS